MRREIEEEKEVERIIEEAGEQAAFNADVSNLPPEVLKMLGRLKIPNSHGPNPLSPCVETLMIGGGIAADIGANAEVAKIGGLLHDIGKAMDYNTEATHSITGAEFCRRYRINPEVINAIE